MKKIRPIYKQVEIDGFSLPWSPTVKYLGVVLDQRLTWRHHVQEIKQKFMRARNELYPLIHQRSLLSLRGRLTIYTAVLRAILTYVMVAWVMLAATHIKTLSALQNKTIRTIAITGAPWFVRNAQLQTDLNVLSFEDYICSDGLRPLRSSSPHEQSRHLVTIAGVHLCRCSS